MKIIKDSKYKLLVQKLKSITEVIDSENPAEEKVYEATIDFVLVFEHIIKKFLYNKNKLLIYNFGLNDIDKVSVILMEQKNTLFTIQLSEALPKYIKLFPKSRLNKQGESIEILINNRNQLEHSINTKNMQSKEELLGILGNVFPVFLIEAEKVLGVLPSTKIRKEKTYSEKDIQDIYENIVLEKIKNYKTPLLSITQIDDNNGIFNSGISNIHNFGSEQCPRCSNYSLSKKYNSTFYSFTIKRDNPDLYTCSNCNLELTNLEYEAVQKLKKEGKITNSIFKSFF